MPPDANAAKSKTNEDIVRDYITVKDERDAFSKEADRIIEEYDAKLEEGAIELLARLNTQKTDSFAVLGHTVYKHTDVRPMAEDWDTIYRWIVKNEAFDLLEKRLKKTFVEEYMAANKGRTPPGMSTVKKFVAKVRRNPKKKEKAYNNG